MILLMGAIYCCICRFYKWSGIQTHSIQADISALGVSDKRHCTFRIRINAGGLHSLSSDSAFQNSIIVYDSTTNNKDFHQYDFIETKFPDLYYSHHERIKELNRFYILNYLCTTTIAVDRNLSKSSYHDTTYCFSYIESPKWEKKDKGSSYSGSGFVAFSKKPGYGGGELAFSTNLTNEVPKMRSNWDITQSNYEIRLKTDNIPCDTISIDFIGAVNFSHMLPSPDKITMSSIEFVDPVSINEIKSHGLRFHAEFIELKELSAKRTFILTAIMSLLISIFANVIFQGIYEKR